MPAPSIRPVRGLALALVLAGGPACGGDDDANLPVAEAASLPPRPGAARQSQDELARAGVDALLASPSPATLLAVLGQGHLVARALLGRHTLKYTAEFSLAPVEAVRPAVDTPVLSTQKVVDELELQWGAGPEEPVRFYLSQHTDQHRGREVMVLDEKAYTRLLHRGWHVRPLDADLHQRWLDEAQRSVHDVVELAAPALAVAAAEEGDTVRVTLSLAEAGARVPVPQGAAPGREWREKAEITAIEGTLTLERATGLWQTAEVRIGYGVRDEQGRALVGETHLTGTAARTPELQIQAPEHVLPLPERVRYESERRRLLDGLAGT
ncbi:hypothetical protein OV090_32050 [Nannocystis sp. RBIL2]|uniref:hypothetical protein n=1 Tax=Nannocystis sp. RBIL2 TaxID=2996788 RepID=UPI00226F9B76|nr:hypothetical protein [Nannocystis sp. RBIL2]MCY1069418.1 hypothetical protein [Nannocystis sp. RBIL2]